MAWPLVAGLALAAGGAAANYFGNKAQAENLEDAYDRIQGLSDTAVGANSRDIQAYRDMVERTYGKGANAYDQALQDFLNSEVYQNQDFSYGKDINEFLDPAMNQRVDAAMQAMNLSGANAGSMFSSDFANRMGARQQSMASEEWEKAYQRLMQDRQVALNEYNTNSQNQWNNYNANQSRMKEAVNAYGSDRDRLFEGQGTALGADIQNRLGGLQTQAQTIMGAANAKQGTSGWDFLSGVAGAGGNFLANYFGGK